MNPDALCNGLSGCTGAPSWFPFVTVALLALNIYIIGAFLSRWTFLGVPISMRP